MFRKIVMLSCVVAVLGMTVAARAQQVECPVISGSGTVRGDGTTYVLGQLVVGKVSGGGIELEQGAMPCWLAESGGPVCRGSESIKKAKCKRKRGVNRLLVLLKNGLDGDSYTVELSSGETREGTLNRKGKAKAVFTDVPSGKGTATATWGCGAEAEKNYECR